MTLNYLFATWMIHSDGTKKKVLASIAILSNLIALFVFKYANFTISTVNHFVTDKFSAIQIILPLGISFYTMQQIAFLVDTYNGEIGSVSVVDYFLYVSFFPQLVQGPIVLYKDMAPQLNDTIRKKMNYDNLMRGIIFFVNGLFKKVIIADSLGKIVSWGMGNYCPELSIKEIIVVVLSFSFQIYFDFSGYCDMALAIGWMFNIDLPKNFNSPYKAITLGDFWDRWHISLTKFFTKYIYIPLGGSRKGKLRTLINILIVFLISGVWHGANWTFILWGMLHGIGMIVDRVASRKPVYKLEKLLNWTITFGYVSILWLLFRSQNIDQWLGMLKGIFINDQIGFSSAFYTVLSGAIMDLIGVGFGGIREWMVWGAILFCLVICIAFKDYTERISKCNVGTLFWTIIMFAICFMSLGGETTFLYFDF